MHIGVAGPIDVTDLSEFVEGGEPLRRGYAFPFTSVLVRQYLARGHRVTVFAEDEGMGGPRAQAGRQLTIHVVPMRGARARAVDAFRDERRQLKQRMQESDCDVIHAHWTYEFALAALSSRKPTLVTAHDWAPAVLAQHRDVYRTVRLAMQMRVLTRAHWLSAVSPYIQTRVAAISRTRPVLIPNAVQMTASGERHRSGQPGWDLGALNVDFTRRKNVQALLAAHHLLRGSANHPVRLHLAGPGYEPGGPCERWAAEKGLALGVQFHGPLPSAQVPGFLAGLDLFVHPSLEESFGMAVLEAIAVGTPVVVHQGALGPHWIVEGRAENLADCRDPASLARAIDNHLLHGPALADAAALRARAAVRFGLNDVVAAYLDLLVQAAGAT